MEKLAAYKLDLDLEIWEMQHKKQYEDEDSDEDEYVPMLKHDWLIWGYTEIFYPLYIKYILR